MSEANSEFVFSFFKIHEIFKQKLPLRIERERERERDSIEFERSENIGQFFIIPF